jgi:hypothetical protein
MREITFWRSAKCAKQTCRFLPAIAASHQCSKIQGRRCSGRPVFYCGNLLVALDATNLISKNLSMMRSSKGSLIKLEVTFLAYDCFDENQMR